MIARRFVAAGAITIAVVASPAAIATAAPVDANVALLSAPEFPAGSTAYKTSTETVRRPSAPADSSRCAKISFDQDLGLAGMRQTQAVVRRGGSFLAAGIADRPITAETREYWRVCLAEDGLRMTTLQAPPDLAHLRPMLIGIGRNVYQAAVDVRGVTVLAGATNRDGGPADLDGFWQVLRAQVAKVERQP